MIMQTTAVDVLAIVLGSNLVLEITREIIKRVRKDSPEQIALRALCEDRLGVLLRDWLHEDVRLADDWRIIENLYEGYTALEGNGEIRKLYQEASEIKTTE
jgi:hypothetical protein